MPGIGTIHGFCASNQARAICARVTPALTAAFQPTVIDMSMFGASAVLGCVGGNQPAGSPSTIREKSGDVDAAKSILDAAGSMSGAKA